VDEHTGFDWRSLLFAIVEGIWEMTKGIISAAFRGYY
jgi:hypothetical protein